MAKKQLTPEEYKAKLEIKEAKKERFSKTFLSAIAVLLSLVITFSIVSIAQTTMMTVGNGGTGAVSSNNAETENKEDGSNIDWSEGEMGEGEKGETGEGEGEAANQAPTTPIAQYNLFMKAFTGVKTNAKSATLVKKNAFNYKNHVKAGALSALGETLMSSLLKEESVNKTYTGADIAGNFPPSGHTCNLKTDDIAAISCKEEGNFYVITIKVKAETDPEFGYGVGSVASILTKKSIQDPISNVPLINQIEPKCAYDVTEVTAKIEKDTGNLVEYYFNLPMILYMDSYEIGLGFEEWWTVAY